LGLWTSRGRERERSTGIKGKMFRGYEGKKYIIRGKTRGKK
jgi:hypothetical protein